MIPGRGKGSLSRAWPSDQSDPSPDYKRSEIERAQSINATNTTAQLANRHAILRAAQDRKKNLEHRPPCPLSPPPLRTSHATTRNVMTPTHESVADVQKRATGSGTSGGHCKRARSGPSHLRRSRWLPRLRCPRCGSGESQGLFPGA